MPGKESTAKQTMELIARYLRYTNPGGTYALTISRETGTDELWCGFSVREDADAFAKDLHAQFLPTPEWATGRLVILDADTLAHIEARTPQLYQRPHRKKDEEGPREPRVTARLPRWVRDED